MRKMLQQLHVLRDGACNWWNSSLRVSPPIWASATETRFTRPNRRACSLARLLRETSPWPYQYFFTFAFTFYAERRYKLKSKPFSVSPAFIAAFSYPENVAVLWKDAFSYLPPPNPPTGAPAESRSQGSLSCHEGKEREVGGWGRKCDWLNAYLEIYICFNVA